MHRIERLELHGLGPFENLDLELGPAPEAGGRAHLHLFTGQNGTGKTTLLRALAGLYALENQDCIDQLLARRRHPESGWYAGMSLGGATIVAKSHSGAFESRLPNKPQPRRLLTADRFRALGYGDDAVCQEYMRETSRWRSDPREPDSERISFGAFGYSGMRQIRAAQINAIVEPQVSPFQGALAFDVGDSRNLLQWVANAHSKAALYEQRGGTEKAKDLLKAFHQVEAAIQEIVGKPVAFILEIDPIDVRFRVGGDTVSFDVLPDGLKSILSWLADLAMRLERIPWAESRPYNEQPFVLLLDEVDVHLHPAWQRRILPVVQELFPNAQIFATTHSPFVVGSVSSGWIYRFDLKDDGTAYLEERFEARPGQSVDWILEEVFGVPERFDLETERLLKELRELREAVLASHGREKKDEWHALVERLKQIGEEVRSIAATEERQVARLLKEAAAREGLLEGAP